MRAILTTLTVLISTASFACEPCPGKLDLNSTIKKADAIAIVRLESYEADVRVPHRQPSGWASGVTQEVFKGDVGSAFLAQTHQGMCAYGLDLGINKPHLAFMVKKVGMHGEYFTSVAQGCGFGSIPLSDDLRTAYIGEKEVPLQVLLRSLKLK